MQVRCYLTKEGDEVQAAQVNQKNARDVAAWCDGLSTGEPPALTPDGRGQVLIGTPEGNQLAEDGDYILKYDDGSLCILHPSVFERAVEEERAAVVP
jgi:hypothetical protein